MKSLLFFTMATCLSLFSCQQNDIAGDFDSENVKLKLLDNSQNSSNFILYYQLDLNSGDSRAAYSSNGCVDISDDGYALLPYSDDNILSGRFIVTEKGQNKYNLYNLNNISINYDVFENTYIGMTTWNEYREFSNEKSAIELKPIQSKIQILTDEDDFIAAQAAGIEKDKIKTEVILHTGNGLVNIPNIGQIGKKIIIGEKPYILLFENDIIVYEKELKSIDLHLSDTDGWNLILPFHNLPMRPDITMSITGARLTSDVSFNITINPGFDGEINN